MTKPELLSLLLQAREASIGILVSTNSPERLRQKLYAVRRDHEELQHLTLMISPSAPESEVLIVDKTELANASG